MITAAQRAVYRKMLLEAGFAPLPLNGKRPVLDDWPSLVATGADIERWAPSAANTGFLTRLTPVLDVDLLDADAAEAVEGLVKDRFGDAGAVLVRVGRPPKRAIPFQTDRPFAKIVVNLIAPNGHEERIEFLADGQQCVTDGIHPDTHKPYRWLGGAPGAVKRGELPAIDEAEAQGLVDDAVELLIAEHGYRRKPEVLAPRPNGAPGGDTSAWGFLGNPIDHDALTAGAMTLLQAGMHDAAAVNFLRATVAGLQEVDEERRGRRLDEIPAMVRSARAKLGDGEAPRTPPPGKLTGSFTAASLEGLPVPPRVWHVPGLVPARTVTLLGGDGGVGKSILALQLAFATAAGLPWVGQLVRQGRSLHLSAEDDRDELHRRSDQVSTFYGTPLEKASALTLWSLADEDAVLVTGSPGQPLQATSRWEELKRFIELDRPALVVLDSLADVYGANENERSQVRQFVRMLRSLAIPAETAVLLLGHPSLTGLSSGSGLSGSTGWNNSVRSRMFMAAPQTEEGGTSEPNLRTLTLMKANYTQPGAELRLRWVAGAFDSEGGGMTSALDRHVAADRVDALFLLLLDANEAAGRVLSDSTGRNYAPHVFAQDPRAAGTSARGFESAMSRAFAAGKIRVVDTGRPSRPQRKIVRVR